MVVRDLTPTQLERILLNLTPTVAGLVDTSQKTIFRVSKQVACNGVAAGTMRIQYFPSAVGVGIDTDYLATYNPADDIRVMYASENRTRYQNNGSSYIGARCYSHSSTATLSTNTTYSGLSFVFPYSANDTKVGNYIDAAIADTTKININPPAETFYTKYLRSTCTPRSYLNDFMQHRQPFGPSKLFKKTVRS